MKGLIFLGLSLILKMSVLRPIFCFGYSPIELIELEYGWINSDSCLLALATTKNSLVELVLVIPFRTNLAIPCQILPILFRFRLPP